MEDRHIEPHKVTKPIQLLAAWMVGLILTNTTFLVAATQFSSDDWERGALVVAAIINVPLFLLALFILQTRFRAELQEDTFYSEYLSKKTSSLVRLDKSVVQESRLEELERAVGRIRIIESEGEDRQAQYLEHLDWSGWPVALNHLHPNFIEVREALRSANIPLSEIFGDAQEGPPSRWIVSLSHSLPARHKSALLKAIIPYGFDGFQFWDPVREADETEDVYIGSYGDRSYARIDDSLSELLQKNVEDSDLRYYYSKHRVFS
ncbi:hypothetical protein [Aeromonas salmonicida]|uniref:hypothetical protein n=1 Tax=Aeromonas salmonicida TaxID=645 RepID=UPI00223FC204|nr:hypothetical protein [Aeromonas salmonicida]